VRLQVSEKDSVFLLKNKAAAQPAISAKLFLANGRQFMHLTWPLPNTFYAPDLAAAQYLLLHYLSKTRFQDAILENFNDFCI
jgi:hypothetical protein